MELMTLKRVLVVCSIVNVYVFTIVLVTAVLTSIVPFPFHFMRNVVYIVCLLIGGWFMEAATTTMLAMWDARKRDV